MSVLALLYRCRVSFKIRNILTYRVLVLKSDIFLALRHMASSAICHCVFLGRRCLLATAVIDVPLL